MALCFRLPAGTYFLGDVGHLYDQSHVGGMALPPLLCDTTDDSTDVCDWLLNDLTWNHHLVAHDMAGIATGERQVACVYVIDESTTTKQLLTLPTSTCVLAPTRIISRAWVTDVDPTHAHGTFVTFCTDVRVTLCVQDWVHSHGYIRLECDTKVVQMEYGLPNAPVVMPPSCVHVCHPMEEFEHISDDDLHALFVALSTRITEMHPRLAKHARFIRRLIDTDDEESVYHQVCVELASRSVKAGADAREHAFLKLSSRKKRKL